MAMQSKYSNAQLDALLHDIIGVLEKHNAPTDLALMGLGNVVSHLLNQQIADSTRRQQLGEMFSRVLLQSLDTETASLN